MLDDYSLRLLAEIGIDVYLPRGAATPAAHDAVLESTRAKTSLLDNASVSRHAEVAIVAAPGQREKLLTGLAGSLRFAGVQVKILDVDARNEVARMGGVVVLGESHARTLGSALDAAQHAALEWVIAAEPDAIARSADAKRALWGEIKRISRKIIAGRTASLKVR